MLSALLLVHFFLIKNEPKNQVCTTSYSAFSVKPRQKAGLVQLTFLNIAIELFKTEFHE